MAKLQYPIKPKIPSLIDSVHPSIILTLVLVRVAGVLEPIPAVHSIHTAHKISLQLTYAKKKNRKKPVRLLCSVHVVTNV